MGLDRVEKFYLEKVLPSADALEGVTARIEGRAPKWQSR